MPIATGIKCFPKRFGRSDVFHSFIFLRNPVVLCGCCINVIFIILSSISINHFVQPSGAAACPLPKLNYS